MTGAALLQMRFTVADLPRLRSRVGDTAVLNGLDEHKREEFVLAAYELASNAIRHGGGGGNLRLSRVDDFLRCQVSDEGPGFAAEAQAQAQPQAQPQPQPQPQPQTQPQTQAAGCGLWLAEQLSDGIEIDNGIRGAIVTLLVQCRRN